MPAGLGGRIAITGIQLTRDRSIDLRVAVNPPVGSGNPLLAVDLVVHLDAPVVVDTRLALAIYVVIEVAGDIRLRDERQRALGHAAELADRYPIVGKWVADEPAGAVGACRGGGVQRGRSVLENDRPPLRAGAGAQIPR